MVSRILGPDDDPRPAVSLGARVGVLLIGALLLGCGGSDPARPPAPPPTHPLAAVNDWCYVLQDPDLTALGASRYDLVVIDYSADGTQAFDAADVTALRASTGGKIVVAYLRARQETSARPRIPSWSHLGRFSEPIRLAPLAQDGLGFASTIPRGSRGYPPDSLNRRNQI